MWFHFFSILYNTVPQKPTNDDCFQTYVLRFKYHLFSQTISNCIFTQFIGFSYLTTKYFLKCSAIYSKILVVEYMMDIFELFINKLASISQNCYYFFFIFVRVLLDLRLKKCYEKHISWSPFHGLDVWHLATSPQNMQSTCWKSRLIKVT